MNKLSNDQIAQVLAAAQEALPKLAQERDFYKEKCAALERRERAEKLASAMQHKGIEADTSYEALVDRFEKVSEDQLQRISDAVDLVSPDMGSKIAQLTDDDTRATPGSSGLERFILGGVG